MLLHDYLDYYAREQGEMPCVIQDDRSLNYQQLAEQVNRLAHGLQIRGLKPGDRIALLSRNSIEMLVVYLAASKTGVVPVPLNWRLAPPEWSYIIRDSGARLLLVEAEFTEGINLVRPELNMVQDYFQIGGEIAPCWDSFDELMANRPEKALKCSGEDQDILYQMYTSGTTGRPKGTLVTHSAILANISQCSLVFASCMGPGKRTLIVMPMFHASAAIFSFISLFTGSTMVIHREYSATMLADALSNHNISLVNLVPAMIREMLVDVDDLSLRDYSQLRAIIYGASPIAEKVLLEGIKVFGCDFYQGYGQTESSAGISFLTAGDHRKALKGRPELLLSAGRPLVGTSLRIVDGEGNDLPVGQAGEIIAKGPQMMTGYWNLPEETEKTLKDGWLHTGDVGMLDQDGYLYIQDRLKDMIVSGGENIYPREVENILFDHASIDDVAVIGLPDEKYGETVMAVIVPDKRKKIL
ncbi:MAG TPA: acyl-CoA synthetase, partial [Sphingomonadales bacterium]|nr:acyl-CoA synthetase [Sphingomonadales bacterium]